MNTIFEGFDSKKLFDIMSKMMTAMMTNQQAEMKEYEVKINVPVAMIEGIKEIAGSLGINETEVLSNMASDGINKFMQGILNKGNVLQDQLMEQKETPQLDLGDLSKHLEPMEKQFGKLDDIVSQLTKLQKAVEHATESAIPSVTQRKDTSNS